MLINLIDNQLNPATKMSVLLPLLEIIARQQKLGDIKKLSNFKKAKRILLISINQN